jgi:hypothetical protein
MGVEVLGSTREKRICRALGVPHAVPGGPKDSRAEGVARLMISVRSDWNVPLSSRLLRRWHGILMAGDTDRVSAGAYRTFPVRVVRHCSPWGRSAGPLRTQPPRV